MSAHEEKEKKEKERADQTDGLLSSEPIASAARIQKYESQTTPLTAMGVGNFISEARATLVRRVRFHLETTF